MKSVSAGERYGKLVAINQVESNGNGEIQWLCKCDCGNTHVARQYQLLNGKTKSCGCLRHEIGKQRGLSNKAHGLSYTRIYRIWRGMMSRCYNTSSNRYSNYGAKGIEVCSEWHDLTNFYRWAISSGYSDELSLDRKNVNGNYEPSNCKWSTIREQSVNKRNSVWVEFEGKLQPLIDVAAKTHISYSTLYGRLKRGEPLLKS